VILLFCNLTYTIAYWHIWVSILQMCFFKYCDTRLMKDWDIYYSFPCSVEKGTISFILQSGINI